MARSLKKKTTVETFRCRKCGLPKKGDEYYKATDVLLDSNGKLSVCKLCCKELFEKELPSGIENAILSICRRLNIVYSDVAVEKTAAKMEELKLAEKPLDILFGVYLQAIHTGKTLDADLTFREPSEPITIKDDLSKTDEILELEKRWGKGFSKEDYKFLDEEYGGWSEDRKTLTKEDITLLEEICHLKLHIKKTRSPDNPVEDLVKQLQGLVKSANEQLKVNKEQEEEGLDTISSIIKIMESQYPADFYKDRGLYMDFEYDMTDYYNKHVTRPIKNFTSGTRDFDFDMASEKDDDIEVDESLPQKEEDD